MEKEQGSQMNIARIKATVKEASIRAWYHSLIIQAFFTVPAASTLQGVYLHWGVSLLSVYTALWGLLWVLSHPPGWFPTGKGGE